MPVTVSCRCGQRFAAPDRLQGQSVPCPVCGNSLSIPAAGVKIHCRCGMVSFAPDLLRGTTTRCPGCRDLIRVPDIDADDLLSSLPPPEPVARGPRIAPPAKSPWLIVGLVAGVCGLVVLVMVAALGLLALKNSFAGATRPVVPPPQQPGVGQTGPGFSRPQPRPPWAAGPQRWTPSNSTPPPPPPTTLRPSPVPFQPQPQPIPYTPAPPPDSSNSGSGPNNAATPVNRSVANLPDAVTSWHEQPGTKLAGIKRVGPSQTPTAHFSWMTGLLPFLGHGATFDRLQFSQSPISEPNLQAGGTVIPEFLNPLDSRQKWQGYPLDGLALTHFVGMSGVEDARNVVAAKLPRSDPRAGIFGYDEVARAEQITDGLSQTIMVVGGGELASPWLLGGGGTIRGAREPLFDNTSGLTMKGLPGGGTLAIMADGSVRHIHPNIDPALFKAMCTIHGSETVDLEKAAAPYSLDDLKK